MLLLLAWGLIPEFDASRRSEEPLARILSAYSSLVSVVNVDGSSIVQFPHVSLIEFLTSDRFAAKRDTISTHYHISMVPAHTLVARACLGILLHLKPTITRHSLMKFPLAEYAAQHWIDHARFGGVSQTMEEGIKQLFDPRKTRLTIWTWIYDPIQPRAHCERRERPSFPIPSVRTPLHYAAFLGLTTVLEFLIIEHSQDVDYRCTDDGSTPLHLASGEGHVEVARILIKHRANITVQDKDGLTPLHWASRQGRMELTRLLMEYGADVGIQDKAGLTPLHWAARQGRTDIARFLVDYGMGATIQDQDGSASILALWRDTSAAESDLRTGGRPLTVNPLFDQVLAKTLDALQPEDREVFEYSTPEEVIATTEWLCIGNAAHSDKRQYLIRIADVVRQLQEYSGSLAGVQLGGLLWGALLFVVKVS